METPTETFYRALHSIVGVPYTPPVATPAKPHASRRTIGAQLTITELGIKWICDVEFSVSHGEVDDYESIAISSNSVKDCPWIDVEFDNLSEDSRYAIEQECLQALGESAEVWEDGR